MKEGEDSLPEIGHTSRYLGARPNMDIRVLYNGSVIPRGRQGRPRHKMLEALRQGGRSRGGPVHWESDH